MNLPLPTLYLIHSIFYIFFFFIFRNRVRRRLIVIEQSKRDNAAKPIQRVIRGHLGRIKYDEHYMYFYLGFPIIQKWFRGELARRKVRLLRATLCVQRAWRLHEASTYLGALKLKAFLMGRIQKEEDDGEDERRKR